MLYDVCVVGAGPAGMIAAIGAARDGKNVLLLEKMPKLGVKLKATGGGRCNLTNTLDNNSFMQAFGKNGRFMQKALELFDATQLTQFFHDLGVQTHAPDGFRIFPTTHNAQSIVQALVDEIAHLDITTHCNAQVTHISKNTHFMVETENENFKAKNLIIATGGLGYPQLGSSGDGLTIAQDLGHSIVEPSPAMMPLQVKESWVASCRADTIAKAHLQVNLKKYKKLRAVGDLIFTKDGIRGPVVLDFSREITPLLKKFDEIPLQMNLIKGKNEDEVFKHFKNLIEKNREITLLEMLKTLLPEALSHEILKMSGADENLTLKQLEGSVKNSLLQNLTATPLSISGHDGFKMAMITRGGIKLKEIDPNTLQSRKVEGLYFCGEVMDLDGPCGGYNLQFSFSSGFLASKLLK